MNKKETRLQHDLTHLRTRLLVMAASVGIAIEEARSCLFSGNIGRAVAIVDGDKAINDLENELDDLSLSLLALHQPVAQDLRFVVATLRIIIELERIGDEAAGIAERMIIMQEALPKPILAAIVPLMDIAITLYTEAIDVLRTGDAQRAIDFCRCDDESTQFEVMALQRIMDYCSNCNCPRPELCSAQSQGKDVKNILGTQLHNAELASDTNAFPYIGMHGILICRSLNRICRRAANIGEYVYFMVKGINIKHIPLPPADDLQPLGEKQSSAEIDGETSPLL